MKTKLNSKMQNYETANNLGAGFVANVILCWHRNPGRKLAGLVRLLRSGKSVRTGQFSIDTLLVDGEVANWSMLETA